LGHRLGYRFKAYSCWLVPLWSVRLCLVALALALVQEKVQVQVLA